MEDFLNSGVGDYGLSTQHEIVGNNIMFHIEGLVFRDALFVSCCGSSSNRTGLAPNFSHINLSLQACRA